MFDRSATPLGLGSAVAAPVPSAAVRAYLALVAGFGAMMTATLLILSVAANSGDEAERIADTQDDGYALTFVSALAVNLSKPLR